jgi:hypothetical protein
MHGRQAGDSCKFWDLTGKPRASKLRLAVRLQVNQSPLVQVAPE